MDGMGDSPVLDMFSKIKKLFRKKKKSYVAEAPDWNTYAYWVLIFSVGVYFIIRAISNKTVALPMLTALPSLIGIFLILFLLPVRAFTFLITEIVIRVRLFHIPQNIPVETVVVIGKNEYRKPSFWLAPNYDTDLLLLVRYLRLLGKPFSVYYNVSIEKLDEIMGNKDIRIVYLVGHGRRHSYCIDGKTSVDYCRYQDPKFSKDYVYQLHCNGGGGVSLIEYVVPKEHQEECLPEHGLMSNVTVNQMFIDKIIALKKFSPFVAKLVKLGYNLLTFTIPTLVFLGWGYLFFRMIA